jgi:hypothetical protein
MWAVGRKEMLRPPGVIGKTWSQARHWLIMLSWVSCTPFGGPVVPEV